MDPRTTAIEYDLAQTKRDIVDIQSHVKQLKTVVNSLGTKQKSDFWKLMSVMAIGFTILLCALAKGFHWV